MQIPRENLKLNCLVHFFFSPSFHRTTPTQFHVGVSSYSRSVIKATALRDDGDVFEIPT